MANHSSGIADFTVPSALFDTHEVMVDYFIDGELGFDVTLNYPPSDTECPNCLWDYGANRSANIYKAGGPYPFANLTTCPLCGGAGKATVPVTDSIRLRVYFAGMELNASLKQFNKLAGTNFDISDGLVFCIGYSSDLPKFNRADFITIPNPGDQEIRCVRKGATTSWGFRHNRYFAGMLERN